jgi:tetratricopeptide (TPR) repeat protein
VEHPPQWLNEGLGELVEFATVDAQGQLEIELHRDFIRRWREGIRGLDPGVLAGRYPLLPLRQLLTSSREAWLAEARSAYAQSWGICHFLLAEGHPEGLDLIRRAVAALVPDASAEENTRRAFEAAFGTVDLEMLERACVAHLDALRVPGHAAFREGQVLREAEKLQEAIVAFSQAVTADPGYSRYHYYRGICRYGLEQYEEAVPDLERALALFPEYTTALMVLARTRINLGQLQRARGDLALLLHLAPEQAAEVAVWRERIQTLESAPSEE